MGQGEYDEVGGDGVIEEEEVGVFGETEGAGEDLFADAGVPAPVAEGLELRLQFGEEGGLGEAAGLDGGAVDGGDYVEVEGGGGVRAAREPHAHEPIGEQFTQRG